MVRHEHISPYPDPKVSGTVAVFDECSVHLRGCQQFRASVSVECYQIDRRVESLENQIQTWRLILEETLHLGSCSVHCLQRTRLEM